MKRWLLFLLVLPVSLLHGQNYFFRQQFTAPNEVPFAHTHAATSDSGYIMLAGFVSSQTESISLIKLSSQGQQQWQLRLAGTNYILSNIVQASDSSYFFSAVDNTDSISGYILVHVSAAGGLVWYKKYSPVVPQYYVYNSWAMATDGGFVVEGMLLDTSLYEYHWHVFKVDAAGNLLWSADAFDNSVKSVSSQAAVCPNGDIVVLGRLYDPAYGFHAPTLARLDANGNFLWSKTYQLPADCMGGIVTATAGGITFATTSVDSAYHQAVFHTDTAGNILWVKKYTGPMHLFFNAIQAMPGGYAVAGNDDNGGLLVNMDTMGNVHWCRTYAQMKATSLGLPQAGGYSLGAGEMNNTDTPDLIVVDAQGKNLCYDDSLSLLEESVTPNILMWSAQPPIAMQQVPSEWTKPLPNVVLAKGCVLAGLPAEAAGENCRVFPSPANDKIYVENNGPVNCARLFTLQGELLLSVSAQSAGFSMDVSGLAPGIYLLQLETASGTATQRVVVQ